MGGGWLAGGWKERGRKRRRKKRGLDTDDGWMKGRDGGEGRWGDGRVGDSVTRWEASE